VTVLLVPPSPPSPAKAGPLRLLIPVAAYVPPAVRVVFDRPEYGR